MENLQSEIIFIAKFGGLVLAGCTHYFYVIKPLAIFNERQRQNRKDIDKIEKCVESHNEKIIVIETNCKKCRR